MSLAQPRILVADDQPDVVEALRLLLKANGFSVVPTSSPAGVLGAVETEDVDVVLMDLNYTRDTTSGREGLELLARLQQLDPQLPVVVMTAWGSVEGAVDAMRSGRAGLRHEALGQHPAGHHACGATSSWRTRSARAGGSRRRTSGSRRARRGWWPSRGR